MTPKQTTTVQGKLLQYNFITRTTRSQLRTDLVQTNLSHKLFPPKEDDLNPHQRSVSKRKTISL